MPDMTAHEPDYRQNEPDERLVDQLAVRLAFRRISRFIFLIASSSLCFYILMANTAPLGAMERLGSNKPGGFSGLEPKDRVLGIQTDEGEVQTIVDDLVYFTTDMKLDYDQATVSVTFKNPNPDQEVSLGFRDREAWHYDTKLLDSPILNDLPGWTHVGTGPYLYQRDNRFKTIEEFSDDIPESSIIGVYNSDPESLKQFQTKIPGYVPAKGKTAIDTPLRGRHTLYAYVKDEQFLMDVTKRDLNWYDDPDPLTVKIYKEDDLVYTATIDDDGTATSTHKIGPPETVQIKNPGPELPETGVYKIIFDCNQDTVITRISSNLHKLTFEGPVYPISNSEVYPGVAPDTRPTTLYSDALSVTALAYHTEATQSARIGESSMDVSETKKEVTAVSKMGFYPITFPKSDSVIKGYLGYFAFSREQFFRPSPLLILPITSRDDLESVDYIFSDYIPGTIEGEWRTARRTFDLKSAIPANGKLSWIIRAPHLKDYSGNIVIKNIEVDFTKKPLVKIPES